MRTSRPHTRPTFIDLFAGAGFFGSAFESAGFRPDLAIEQDDVAAATCQRNVGGDVMVKDLRLVRPQGRCDVLIAGPPCQGFSTLGAMDPSDPRNGLSFEVVKWAKVCRPRVVVIENVEAFLDSPVWKGVTDRLQRLGYEVTAWALDASDYGVAQRRRRSFTVASLIGLPLAPRPRQRKVTLREAWEGLPARPDGKNSHVAPKPSALALARMRVIPPHGDKRDILRRAPHLAPPSWKRCSMDVTDVWGRMDWDEPANTLRTCLQNPSKGRYIHPVQHRVVSLREAARLHSVSDRWVFEGLPTQVARQIGNGVPPALGRAVARSVASLF